MDALAAAYDSDGSDEEPSPMQPRDKRQPPAKDWSDVLAAHGHCCLSKFLELCPRSLQLHIDVKYIQAWLDPVGETAITPQDYWSTQGMRVPQHTIICQRFETVSCWQHTYSWDADQTFTDAQLCEELEEIFEQSEHIFVCDQSDAVETVWRLYSDADFAALDAPHDGLVFKLFLGYDDTVLTTVEAPKEMVAALKVTVPEPLTSNAFRLRHNVTPLPSPSPSPSPPETRKELKSGGKLEGTFVGYGERLGCWDSFEYFEAEEASERLDFFKVWYVVVPGVDHDVVLVRILGGEKKGGAGGRMQACYVCLLYDEQATSTPWLYATLPHVKPTYENASPSLMEKIETALASFTPATVSGATQQALKHAPPRPEKAGGGNGKKRKAE